MTEKILFFFSALGVFNALLLSVYLFIFKSGRSRQYSFLAILVLLVVIRVGVSCFQYFGPIPFEFIKLGLIANLLMGPAVFFFIRSLLEPSKNLVNQSLLHLVIWAFAFAISWFVFDRWTWDWRVRFVTHLALTIYLVVAAVRWRGEILAFIRSEKVTAKVKDAVVVYLSLLAICMGFAISLFTSYVLGPLVFSLVFYGVVGYFLLGRQKQKKRTVAKGFDEAEFTKLSHKLIQLMEAEKLYRNPELSLDLLARELAVSRHLLSQLLNEYLQKSFHQYINDYRIQEACQLLIENKHFSIEAVGTEVGFNSRSSFFSSFKRLKGMTPSNYRKQA